MLGVHSADAGAQPLRRAFYALQLRDLLHLATCNNLLMTSLGTVAVAPYDCMKHLRSCHAHPCFPSACWRCVDADACDEGPTFGHEPVGNVLGSQAPRRSILLKHGRHVATATIRQQSSQALLFLRLGRICLCRISKDLLGGWACSWECPFRLLA